MSGDYTDYEEEKKTDVKRSYSENDQWEQDDEQKLAMKYFQRIVKKSGCQHVSTQHWERLKRLPSWLRIKKESSYLHKKTDWEILCKDDMQRKHERSPKRANNAVGNYFHFRKVAG